MHILSLAHGDYFFTSKVKNWDWKYHHTGREKIVTSVGKHQKAVFFFIQLVDDTCAHTQIYMMYLGDLYIHKVQSFLKGTKFSLWNCWGLYWCLIISDFIWCLILDQPNASSSHSPKQSPSIRGWNQGFSLLLSEVLRDLGLSGSSWLLGTLEGCPARAQSYLICCVLIALLENWGWAAKWCLQLCGLDNQGALITDILDGEGNLPTFSKGKYFLDVKVVLWRKQQGCF